MEAYAHDAPPKVMWGVDDQIRDLFELVRKTAVQSRSDIQEVKTAFEAFGLRIESMIFKEESIPFMGFC